ncbi:unnamed protein product, partial [marine sediment metagenome]
AYSSGGSEISQEINGEIKEKSMALKGFTRNFRPLEILTEEQVEAIHRGTLEVLWVTGVRVEHERALKLFESNGCKVDYDDSFF